MKACKARSVKLLDALLALSVLPLLACVAGSISGLFIWLTLPLVLRALNALYSLLAH